MPGRSETASKHPPPAPLQPAPAQCCCPPDCTQTLNRLAAQARRLAAGKPCVEALLPDRPDGALGRLTQAFRAMARAVQRRERRLRARVEDSGNLVEFAGTALVGFGADGRIVRANGAAERMFGYSRDELTGTSVLMLMAPEEQRRYDGMLDRLPLGERMPDLGRGRELLARRRNGGTFAASFTLTRVEQAQGSTFIAGITDLSEIKKAQATSDAFISAVSHELRTPLTAIKGALGLLKSEIAGTLPNEAQAMIAIAYKNSDQLLRLINDILDLEKIESGKMQFDFRPVHVAQLIRQAREACKSFTDQCGVAVVLGRLTPGLRVIADPDRLMQVLSNLISNAAKFSPPDGIITLAAERRGERVRISVADQGPGIPEAFRDRIFGKFAQAAGPHERNKGGSGLGLSITKAIVEAQGGAIAFRSQPGKGSTFYFELPALLRRRRRPGAAVASAVAASGCNPGFGPQLRTLFGDDAGGEGEATRKAPPTRRADMQ